MRCLRSCLLSLIRRKILIGTVDSSTSRRLCVVDDTRQIQVDREAKYQSARNKKGHGENRFRLFFMQQSSMLGFIKAAHHQVGRVIEQSLVRADISVLASLRTHFFEVIFLRVDSCFGRVPIIILRSHFLSEARLSWSRSIFQKSVRH